MTTLNFLFSKMKTKFVVVLMLIALLVIPSYTFASTVFETTGWITGSQGLNFEFTADQSPYTYQATLTDLSVDPLFGFDFLYLSVTSSTDSLGSIVGPGSFTFDVIPGQTLFANVFGTGDGTVGAGLFGVEVTAVPSPSAIWLLASGLISFVSLRRKFQK